MPATWQQQVVALRAWKGTVIKWRQRWNLYISWNQYQNNVCYLPISLRKVAQRTWD